MNEVRFNPPPKQVIDSPKQAQIRGEGENIKSQSYFGLVLKFFGAIGILILIMAGLFFGFNYINQNYSSIESDAYSAVFLNNGQVYFGKMVSNTKNEIVLNEVFYLQVSDTATGAEQLEPSVAQNQTRFNLVKLGTEMHGPTDQMFINKDHIIFYEYLREDSAVVESIRNYR